MGAGRAVAGEGSPGKAQKLFTPAPPRAQGGPALSALTGLPASTLSKLPPWAREGARALGVLPTPRQVLAAGGLCPIAEVAVLLPAGDLERQAAERVRGHLRSCGMAKVPVVATPEAAERYPLVIAIGDPRTDARVRGYWQEAGSAPLAWEGMGEGAYALAIRCRGRRGRVVLAATSPEGFRNGLSTLRQLTIYTGGGLAFKQAVIVDIPSFARRGIIEGFYGQPWSHQQRLRLLRFAGDYKYNLYVYAPKDDPLHRHRWREPYNQRQLRELRQLVDIGREQGVRFCFAVSPGLSVRYADGEELAALCRKLDSMRALGVSSFALCLDDIEPELQHEQDRAAFPSLAAAQAHFANRLHDHLRSCDPGAELIFCPTEYTGTGGTAYLKALGKGLAASIMVFWTGREVCTPHITTGDADGFGASIRRRPLVWDNYPVNDYDTNRLLLGPIRNRPADLRSHTAGIIANPMNEGEASKLPLATFADYLWNAEAYQPEASWELSIMHLAGGAGYATLRRFARQNMSSFLCSQEAPELAEAAQEFWGDYGQRGAQADGSALERIFRGFTRLPAELERQVDNQFLLADLGGYLQKTRDLGALGLACLRALLEPGEDRREKVAKLAHAAEANSRRVADRVMAEFLERARKEIG